MDDRAAIGTRIEEARGAKGLSAAQLARRIGVKTVTLHSWENGRTTPRSNRLMTLAGVLNVSPTWLLVGDGESGIAINGHLPDELTYVKRSLQELREQANQIVCRVDSTLTHLESMIHNQAS